MFGLPWRRRQPRLEAMQARPGEHAVIIRLIDILNATFREAVDGGATPEVELQRTYVGARVDDRGKRIDLAWKAVEDPDGHVRDKITIDLVDCELPNARDIAELGMTIMLESRRVAMLRAAGIVHGDAEPTWATLIPVTLLSMLKHLDVDCATHTDVGLLTRVERAVTYRSGTPLLTMERHLIGGSIGLVVGTDPFRFVTVGTETVGVRGEAIPQIAIAQLVGRPLSDLVVIGDGTPGVTITSADDGNGQLTLGVISPVMALTPPPEEVKDLHDGWRQAVMAAA